MTMHPDNDKIKIRISKDQFKLGVGDEKNHGTLVEVPNEMIYLGFHSFAFEGSITNPEVLDKILKHYKKHIGKIVYWEALQDKGRRFQEGEDQYVILNMTDIITWDDEKEASAYLIDDIRSGGFKL